VDISEAKEKGGKGVGDRRQAKGNALQFQQPL